MAHDDDIKRSEPNLLSPPKLLNLPLELRLFMYDYVFHSQGCDLHGSCHCGDNLSITNRQFYKETRPLVYNYAKPRMFDLESCISFFRDIQDNTFHVKSLSINYGEFSLQALRLADVFHYPGIEKLEDFNVVFRPSQRYLDTNAIQSIQGIRRTPPVYSLSEERNSPAVVYDMDLRVSKHPLAAMKYLRRLTVEGYPESEIEEAIFKASRNIERLGRREGKGVERWEMENDDSDQFATNKWVYGIAIVD